MNQITKHRSKRLRAATIAVANLEERKLYLLFHIFRKKKVPTEIWPEKNVKYNTQTFLI